MKRLENKVAIITGGASGIGKQAALLFAQEGATVSIWDVNEELGVAVVKEFEKQNLTAEFRRVNVADKTDVSSNAKAVSEKYEKIDILVNNAGITRDATLMKMTEEQWDQVIAVNLKGVFNCTQAVAAVMVEREQGTIINTSSVVAHYGNFGQTNYVATKSGVIGMTKTWARELGRKGIRVNAVAPGFIFTEMVSTVPEKVLDMVKGNTPLGRLGKPEDIANAYLFLASDEASFINGNVLNVDGGLVI